MPDVLLTCFQVARLLAVRPSTIRAWTSKRRIPFIKLNGKAVRYRQSDIERLIKAGEHKSVPNVKNREQSCVT